MGLWHGHTKEYIKNQIWNEEYYKSQNDLTKEYYTQEIQAFADYLNSDSEEEYKANCAKYLTAVTRKKLAESGNLSKEEIEEATISQDTALNVITSGFKAENGHFFTTFEDFNASVLTKKEYEIWADLSLNLLVKKQSEKENTIIDGLKGLATGRKNGKEMDEAQSQWASLSEDQLVSKLGIHNSLEHFHTSYKNRRFDHLEKSMERHAANALKTKDEDVFFDEITEMLIDYTNFKTIVKRPDLPMEAIRSDNEMLRPQFKSKLKNTYGKSWNAEVKLDIWKYFGDDQLDVLKSNADILYELPDAIKNNPREFGGNELWWYSVDRDELKIISYGKQDDGSDQDREKKVEELNCALHDVFTCDDINNVYDLCTDYLLKFREYDRFNSGATPEERIDTERLQYHNEKDRPKILAQVKEDLKDKSLYEIKEFVLGNYISYSYSINKELELPYFLETQKYNEARFVPVDRPTWETIKQQPEDEMDLPQDADAAENDKLEGNSENGHDSEVVETEEEKQARLKKEKIEGRIQNLNLLRSSASKKLNDTQLAELNARFDHLNQAVSSDDPNVIIENLAYVLASEHKSGLKKTESILNLGEENFSENVKIFQNILRDNYTDEQITSDEFINKFISKDRIKKFGEDVNQYTGKLTELNVGKLKEILEQAGIDTDNKYSMMKLSIINAGPKALPQNRGIEGANAKISAITDLRVYPALGLTINGLSRGELARWNTLSDSIEKQASALKDSDAATMSSVFNGMTENRLIVDADDGIPEHARFITMAPRGPMLTATVAELKLGLEKDSKVFIENGFSSIKAMQSALKTYDKVIFRENLVPGIIEQGTKNLLSPAFTSKGKEKVLSEMNNLQMRSYGHTALRGMLKMGNENLTKENVSKAFPKTSKEIAEELVSQVFPPVEVEINEVKTEEVKLGDNTDEPKPATSVEQPGKQEEVTTEEKPEEQPGKQEEVKTEEKPEEQPGKQEDVKEEVKEEVKGEVKEEPKPEEKVEAQPGIKEEEQAATAEETLEQETATFAKLAKALEKAKTITNSKEYNNIITLCSNLGNPKSVAKMGVDGRKAFLAATGKAINDYITHKAKDGIKPNVFKKFVAVEVLSKYVGKKLEPYKNETLDIGKGQQIAVDSLNLRLKEKRNSCTALANHFEQFLFSEQNITTGKDAIVEDNVKRSMKLGTNLLRKVALESGQKFGGNLDKQTELVNITKKFTDSEFVKDEIKGKSIEEIAPEKKGGIRI